MQKDFFCEKSRIGKTVGFKRGKVDKARVVEVNDDYSVCKTVGSAVAHKDDIVSRE